MWDSSIFGSSRNRKHPTQNPKRGRVRPQKPRFAVTAEPPPSVQPSTGRPSPETSSSSLAWGTQSTHSPTPPGVFGKPGVHFPGDQLWSGVAVWVLWNIGVLRIITYFVTVTAALVQPGIVQLSLVSDQNCVPLFIVLKRKPRRCSPRRGFTFLYGDHSQLTGKTTAKISGVLWGNGEILKVAVGAGTAAVPGAHDEFVIDAGQSGGGGIGTCSTAADGAGGKGGCRDHVSGRFVRINVEIVIGGSTDGIPGIFSSGI
jgi:hypothetical protein